VGHLPPSFKGWVALASALAPVAAGTWISTPAGMIVGAGAGLTLLVLGWPSLRTRGLAVALTVVAIGVVTALGLAVAATVTLHDSSPVAPQPSPPPVAPQPPPVAPPAPVPPAPEPKRPQRPRNLLWDETCASKPGAGAPDFAAKTLYRLLLGPALPNVDPPPGVDDGGCTGHSLTTSGNRDTFAYVVGADNNGSVKSIAIVSRRFGPAIFLAPAATRIRDLIKRYLDIGGWPRTDVGHGDYYGVKTPFGTAILMRPTKVIDDGSGLLERYVVLLPTAATLWLESMRRHGSWLYALRGRLVHGERRIRLVASLETEKLVEVILVTSKTGTARLAGRRSSSRRFGEDMKQAEVEAYVRRAL